MGVGYILVNVDKREQIRFYRIDTGTKLRELSGTAVASAIVTYYLLTSQGDRVGFVDDFSESARVCGTDYERDYFKGFVDVTDRVVEELLEQEVLQDNGILWVDKEDDLYNRDLVNIWNTRKQQP